jgi:hypothetical protein
MLVLFGLNETQSKIYQFQLSKRLLNKDLTISVVDHRILYCDVRTSIGIPSICILCRVIAFASPGNIDIVKDYVGGIGDEMIVLGRVAQNQIT